MGLQITSQTESVEFTYNGESYKMQGSLNHTSGVLKRLDLAIFSVQEEGVHLGNISLSETGSCSVNVMNGTLLLSIVETYETLKAELINNISPK